MTSYTIRVPIQPRPHHPQPTNRRNPHRKDRLTMRIKLGNIRAGYADVFACDPHPRHVGHVYLADEITDEKGRTVAPAGWVPVTLHRESHANQPQFPRLLSRQSAAFALATNDSLLLG